MTDHYYNNKYLDECNRLGKIHSPEIKTIKWESPSNIALIKYWGKYGNQMPNNPSISFTLSQSTTRMNIEYSSCREDSTEVELYLDDIRNDYFEKKLALYLKRILPFFPFLNGLKLKIQSHNTFPHSAGIASSASSFSALALCLCSIERENFNTLDNINAFCQKASFIARIGSGSACRSVFGSTVLWGLTPQVTNSSNEVAIPINDLVAPVFTTYCDAIIIVDSSAKKISSSTGHILMDHHPYSEARQTQSRENLKNMLDALASGDELKFSQIVENEAFSLHGLILSSTPGYILLHPNSIQVIRKIQDFRQQLNRNFTFTLDAGPNIHILYPKIIRPEMVNFIDTELKEYCEGGIWIDDKVSKGPAGPD
jgi:diphosphomevalonate decarboxylase